MIVSEMEKILNDSTKDVESLRVVFLNRDDIVVESRFGKCGFCKELLIHIVSSLLVVGGLIVATIISSNIFYSYLEKKIN